MLAELKAVLPVAFGFSGVMYLWLAVRVSRSSPEAANNAISFFLFLIGAMVIGSAFSYGASDPNLYGIGRTFSFFAGGFLPVVFYRIYREYTAGHANMGVIAMLSILPAASTVIAITNPLHHMLWTITETPAGALEFSQATEHFWFNSVHAPFAYAVFGYSLLALAGRLPTIARAHRRKIVLLLVCAVLPYSVSLANTVFEIGPYEFPFTSSTLTLLLPLYWWAGVTLRVHEFSPLAYQTLFDHVRDPIIVLDRSQRIISANQPAQHLLKSDERRLVGRRLWEDPPEARVLLDPVPDGDLSRTVRINTDRYFELNSAPLVGRSGQNQGTVVVCRDVTERKQALRALADSEHLIRSLVEHSSNGILRFARDAGDRAGFRCTFANRAAEKFLNSGGGSVVGTPLEKLTLLEPAKLLERFGGEDTGNTPASYENEVATGDGDNWLRIVGEPVGQDFSVTLIDITERKRNETRILADALRDPLTGVLNRRGFEKAAPDSIRRNAQGAVLYLDLNHFKSINDRFGHPVGDALLKAFGHRLEFCLRPEDILARMGGDEFAIILPGVGVEDAKLVAERLVETASEAYIIQGQEINCTASVGIALMPRHGDELWHLVSVADQAMYNVKSISEEEAANDLAAYVEAAIAS